MLLLGARHNAAATHNAPVAEPGRLITGLAAAVLVLVLLGGPSSVVSAGGPDGLHPFMREAGPQGTVAALSAPVSGFQDSVVLSGLTSPTAVRFAPDGRVLIVEKSGRLLVYPSLTSTSPIVAFDINTLVHDFWDRGLLGLELDPSFTSNGVVYVLYTHDHIIGSSQAPPQWGDGCPNPPGATSDGCVASARLSRVTLTNNVRTSGYVLVEDWCQQFPSHSVGAIEFGPDGFLYASAGDGASFNAVDWGQFGGSPGSPTPANPCGDPPGRAGVANTSPSGRGGALRSQSLRRPAGEPVTLDGTIIRVDPVTGAAAPGNPIGSSAGPNAARIVATGLRNPFRFTFRPGTSELWVGDVGWSGSEEINRLIAPAATPVENFGWPCYEGNGQQSGYSGLTMCQDLYAAGAGAVVAPAYAYSHGSAVVAGDNCPTSNGSSITGLAFYQGGSYPSKYANALFFADHSRNCIWAMLATSGVPDPTRRELFVGAAANPVDLRIGPGGDLFYVDHEGGTLHRVTSTGANTPPTATFSATPSSGAAPLDVAFDGRSSSDPDGDSITYAWDFTADGVTDATGSTTTFRYGTPGLYTARLTVTDSRGAASSATRTINAGNGAPVVTITSPAATHRWAVGDAISFAGSATDPEEGQLPATALTWTFAMLHCTTPQSCHSHLIETRSGVSSGTFSAPDHEYPSFIDVSLRATDGTGSTTTSTVRLNPRTVDLPFETTPNGLGLSINGSTSTGSSTDPTITRTFIVNSQNTVTAASPQVANGIEYDFASWSDGSTAASRTIVAPTTPWTSPLTASFRATSADLSVAQSGVLSANRSSIAWMVTVRNATGGLTASSVTVTIAVSSNLGSPTFDAPGWTCSYSGTTQTATCTTASIAAGASGEIRYATPVIAKRNNRAENTASAASATRDVVTSNNTVTTGIRLR